MSDVTIELYTCTHAKSKLMSDVTIKLYVCTLNQIHIRCHTVFICRQIKSLLSVKIYKNEIINKI